ncbi:hypothetical protein F5Y19DRAFT_285522 [Xylariaceae sp. FL1651]|nr:hypothetical protein F5Y19DRAFT_285522 [Xylariaceae sp. FL1651]
MKLESIYQVSDDHLRELWGALRYKIQSHTNQRFKYKPIAPTSEFFLDFTSQASEYMLHETTRKKLFEAVIWRFIVKHIFSLDGLVWAGPAQDGFKNLSKNLVACVRDGSISWEDYHAWRARSAGMLLRAYPDDFTRKFEEEESPLEMLMIELEQILQPFQILGYDEDANPNTFDILKDAINIDVQLRQSRADYWIYLYHPIEHHGFDYDFRQAPGNEFRQIPNGKPYGFEFNSTLMDRENGASGQGAKILQVQLVVSPTVIKRGTANGDQYDHHTVIVKGVVLCNNIRSRVDATSSVFV